MARDLSQEPLFPTDEIQGDILVGLIKKTEHLLFFRIDDAGVFKTFLKTLHITSMQEALDLQALLAARKAAGFDRLIPAPGLNVAFTAAGMTTLDVPDFASATVDDDLRAFEDGMAARGAVLADPPAAQWTILKDSAHLHGVFILTGSTQAEIANLISSRLAPFAGNGWSLLHEEIGLVRPDPTNGHEHFGFADGVSQPGVRGTIPPGEPLTPTTSQDENQGAPGQDLLWPGEFVFGYAGQDPHASDFPVKGPVAEPPIPFMANGAYLVFRRLAQLVPEFNAAVKEAAATTAGSADPLSPDLLGAQMVGRWKSGAPVILAPTADDPAFAEDEPRTNDFEFGGDRLGLVCPWAAHVRKAYPRDDVRHVPAPTPDQVPGAEAFTQAHRMLRRGIAFGPELTEHEAKTGKSASQHRRGLLFKCYVTSIPDQFEFVQQRWVDAGDFSQVGAGLDPIIGQGAQPKPWLGAAPFSKIAGNKPSFQFNDFVQMQGGAYFFAPSITAIRSLPSTLATASKPASAKPAVTKPASTKPATATADA